VWFEQAPYCVFPSFRGVFCMIWVGFYVKGKDILVHISEFNVIYIGEETL
jgi:hypothetical protein